MPHPALVPAVALLAGVAFTAAFPVLPQAAMGLALVSVVAAAASCRFDAGRMVVVVTAIGFAAVGAALGSHDEHAARNTPLRVWFDHRGASEPVAITLRLVEDAAPTRYGATLRGDATTVDGTPTRGGVRLAVSGAFVTRYLAEWRAGRTLRVAATLRRPATYLNPGLNDEEVALARRGVVLVGSVKSAALVEVVKSGSFVAEAAAACRQYVRTSLNAAIDSRQASAIVIAILVGDRAGLSADLEDRLQRAGTYHVIAISGGNIAILAGLIVWLAFLAGVAWRPAAAAVIVFLVLYAQIVSAGASVSRAVLVACAAFGARFLDHRVSGLNAVASAAAVIVCVNPLVLHDAGFALSFGATVGILLGVPACSRAAGRQATGRPASARWRIGVVGAAVTLFAATLCAELATVPIAASSFSRVTTAGLVLNFAAIPLMTVAQVAGLATVAASGFDETLARCGGVVAAAAVAALVETTRVLDWLPGLSWRVPAPPAWTLVCYYGALALLVRVRTRIHLRQAAGSVAVASLVAMLVAPLPRAFPGAADRLLRVTHVDVGQGDATLLRFPTGEALLVDAGGAPGAFDVGARIVAPTLWALRVRRLTALVLTHGDPDHVGGALAVLRDFRPREVWEGVPVAPHAPTQALKREAGRLGAGWRRLRTGDAITFGDVRLLVRHPPPPTWERQRIRNDDSIVLEIRYGSISIVLPGDIGADVERVIAGSFADARVRLLKAPHHGSATSSSAAFLDTLRPRVTVISAGRANRYGHPAAAVLKRYEAAGIEVFRTDIDGAISVETDGTRLDVRGFSTARRHFTATASDPSR